MRMESVEPLLSSLPVLTSAVGIELSMEMLSPKEAPRTCAVLAKHGFPGYLPIGRHSAGWVGLLLEPDRALAETSVVELLRAPREGVTFAPDLARLVAGRIAYMNVIPAKATRKAIASLAVELGDRGAVERVLEVTAKMRASLDPISRSGKLFASIAGEDPLFEILSIAWCGDADAATRSIKRPPARIEGHLLYAKLALANAYFGATGGDRSEEAWRVVQGDISADFTYTGTGAGLLLGARAAGALVWAAKALDGIDRPRDTARAASLEAARAFAAKPEKYDGAAHLTAAKQLAAKHPALAYQHALNAATAYARKSLKVHTEAISLALTLAQDHGWADIATILEWTLTPPKT